MVTVADWTLIEMFCRPPEPPERSLADRYADTRGELISGETSPVTVALALALLQLGGWRRRAAGRALVSTEGGRGRAEPASRLGDDIGSQAWRELQAVPEGGDWLDELRRGFRAPGPGRTA